MLHYIAVAAPFCVAAYCIDIYLSSLASSKEPLPIPIKAGTLLGDGSTLHKL